MEAIRATKLAAGMKVAASYKRYNEGTDLIEILGVTDDADCELPKWSSVKEALASISAPHRRALKGSNLRLVVRDLGPRDDRYPPGGAWYYEFEGRFCRGSGAEPLSFELLTETEATEEAELLEREVVAPALQALGGFMAEVSL